MKQQNEASQKHEEHILVCLSSSPSNPHIIDEASEIAKAFQGEFTALYVQKTPEYALSEEDEKRLQYNIRYAQDKGAAITTVIGENIPFQIAEFARLSFVTKIVIGRSNTKRYHFWERQTLTDQLIVMDPNMDIYIIPDYKIEMKDNHYTRLTNHFIPTVKDLMITVALLVGTTFFGFCFSQLGFTESNIIMVYILGVLICAILTTSHVCSLISSFCSVLLFNYFFTEPKLSFHAYETGYTVTFAIMFAAAFLTGSLAYRLKNNARESARAAFRTKVLFDTNRLLQKCQTTDEVYGIAAKQVMLLLECDVVIYPVLNNTLQLGYVYRGEGQVCHPVSDNETEKEVLDWVFEHQKEAGATTEVFPKAKYLYLAICSKRDVYGIIGMAIHHSCGSFEFSIILSILGECALALENIKNAAAKKEAALEIQNEKLRANILRTISHDLRTPLTSISGNASNLYYHYHMLDDKTRAQIFEDIYDESEWLIQLVENLLSVSRIDNGQIQINQMPEVLDDVIDEAMKHVDRNRVDHEIRVEHPKDLVIANMDAKLITQVIINIVNNAIKYTGNGSMIVINYESVGDVVYVRITDNGPGLSDEMKNHVFDMFYSGDHKVADGKKSIGLGLSLCKSVVEAHGGTISVKDNEPSGCSFTFTLERGEVAVYE